MYASFGYTSRYVHWAAMRDMVLFNGVLDMWSNIEGSTSLLHHWKCAHFRTNLISLSFFFFFVMQAILQNEIFATENLHDK